MNEEKRTAAHLWAPDWLNRVAEGGSAMSQRKRSTVELRGGGLDAVRTVAKEKGVHLLLLQDDHGEELIAASTRPFLVIC